jgi:hypothetical protein
MSLTPALARFAVLIAYPPLVRAAG